MSRERERSERDLRSKEKQKRGGNKRIVFISFVFMCGLYVKLWHFVRFIFWNRLLCGPKQDCTEQFARARIPPRQSDPFIL